MRSYLCQKYWNSFETIDFLTFTEVYLLRHWRLPHGVLQTTWSKKLFSAKQRKAKYESWTPYHIFSYEKEFLSDAMSFELRPLEIIDHFCHLRK